MEPAMWITVFILITLVAIVGSLGAGLVFMLKDRGQSDRTVKALTVRIALSVTLFLLLLLGFATGIIKPHGIYPTQSPPQHQS
jgi:hypothetical protein